MEHDSSSTNSTCSSTNDYIIVNNTNNNNTNNNNNNNSTTISSITIDNNHPKLKGNNNGDLEIKLNEALNDDINKSNMNIVVDQKQETMSVAADATTTDHLESNMQQQPHPQSIPTSPSLSSQEPTQLPSSTTTTVTSNTDDNLDKSPTTNSTTTTNMKTPSRTSSLKSTKSEIDVAPPTQTQTPSVVSLSQSQQLNSVLFYGITYLGCASVNAPKSEVEITRIMCTLNEQSLKTPKNLIEIIMSVPNNVNDRIQLFDAQTEIEISTYKMSQVLFVVRGSRGTTEECCFAFTTCHGDSLENLIFPCHVFKCNLSDAVSKILYSFWTVFKRQQMMRQRTATESDNSNTNNNNNNSNSLSSSSTTITNTTNNSSSSTSTTGPAFSMVASASSLLNSFYGGSQQSLNLIGGSQTTVNSSSNGGGGSGSGGGGGGSGGSSSVTFGEQVAKYLNVDYSNQYQFRTIVEIKEEINGTYLSVPKDKEFFKLRKNIDKNIFIQVQQVAIPGKPQLEIQRCFGVLLCAGRNCNVSDMQLLETLSMGKSNDSKSSYQVCAHWNPRDPIFNVLNEETQKNMKVFMTIALDLVIDSIQEPVRFCIETKARVYAQTEKFWVYQRTKFSEDFYLHLKQIEPPTNNNDQTNQQQTSSTSLNDYHLDSIHSHTELLRKLNAYEMQQKQQQQIEEQRLKQQQEDGLNNGADLDGDDNEIVFSGMGNVSKDLDEDELSAWVELMKRWRKNYLERPSGLKQLILLNGIPESLRGEVWQLLAGCIDTEKYMHESYRLLLNKESASEQVILRDINRTFPGHQFFQDENGQQALYKLSKAYSIYDQEIGYCQGLSFLIATLLLHMPEEQSFNLLVKIMYSYQIRDIYKTNFESLHLRFYQLEQLIHELIPELHEHFIDLNIETHMYASQWFLTLYTAKFPLYMVYRIIDLFLLDGFNVLFVIGISLLRCAKRELLTLDFEGVLKYFRVQLPKKYRNEVNFKDLIQTYIQVQGKITNKKLKKLEKNYLIVKEIELSKEDPLIRAERDIKRFTQTIRRLEQENDDLANEYIDCRMQLNRQLDETRDLYENLKAEYYMYKQDTKLKFEEQQDRIENNSLELDKIKQLWRSQSDKYEHEIERQQTINSEYKQICNKLSAKIEFNENIFKQFEILSNKYKQQQTIDDALFTKIVALIESNNNNQSSSPSSSSSSSDHTTPTHERPTTATTIPSDNTTTNINYDLNTSLNSNNSIPAMSETDAINKIKQLELELARVKLELVDAQCKNQEFTHKFKTYQQHGLFHNGASFDSSDLTTPSSFSNNSSSVSHQYQFNSVSFPLNRANSATGTSSNNSQTNANANANSWLSKRFSQFKEATNQVVQKVKTNSTNSETN